MRILLYTILLFLPTYTFATVTISEVAWMGDTNSANNEWIELYNTGDSAEDITDWTLTDNNSLNILLSGVGSIGAGQYVVLERNRSSEQYLYNPPFFIYTGALVNSGATLTLIKSDGIVADAVSGGEGWVNIGGDNASKDTAQLTSTGWVTAMPTPGKANTNPPISSSVSIDLTQTQTKTVNTTNNVIKAEPLKVTSKPTLQISLLSPKTAYVNQKVNFEVQPSGLTSALTSSLRHEWNFGDLATSSQKKTTHAYEYPGTYVITLYSHFASMTATARKEITVLPVTVSLTTNSDGDIQINNDAPYEIDLSGYTLVGGVQVPLPPRTVILSKSTITVPAKKLNLYWGQPVVLYDTKKIIIASTADVAQDSDKKPSTVTTSSDSGASGSNPSITTDGNSFPEDYEDMSVTQLPDQFGFISDASNQTTSPAVAEIDSVSTESITLPSQSIEGGGEGSGEANTSASLNTKNKATPTTNPWPYLGLIILLTIAIASLFLTQKKENT